MLTFLLAMDLLLIGLVGSFYSLVTREARRGRDIILEMTHYQHFAEDMLPLLRLLLLFGLGLFLCLCSLLTGQARMLPDG